MILLEATDDGTDPGPRTGYASVSGSFMHCGITMQSCYDHHNTYCGSSIFNISSLTAQVSIHVLDENDNRPAFLVDTYDLYQPENTPVGTTLVTVTARDPDLRENGTLSYRILDGDTNGRRDVDLC